MSPTSKALKLPVTLEIAKPEPLLSSQPPRTSCCFGSCWTCLFLPPPLKMTLSSHSTFESQSQWLPFSPHPLDVSVPWSSVPRSLHKLPTPGPGCPPGNSHIPSLKPNLLISPATPFLTCSFWFVTFLYIILHSVIPANNPGIVPLSSTPLVHNPNPIHLHMFWCPFIKSLISFSLFTSFYILLSSFLSCSTHPTHSVQAALSHLDYFKGLTTDLCSSNFFLLPTVLIPCFKSRINFLKLTFKHITPMLLIETPKVSFLPIGKGPISLDFRL